MKLPGVDAEVQRGVKLLGADAGVQLGVELLGVVVEVGALPDAGGELLVQPGPEGAEGGAFGLLVLPALPHHVVIPGEMGKGLSVRICIQEESNKEK